VFFDKSLINKNTSSSRIDEGLHKESLGGVGGFKSNKKIQRSSASIESTDNRV